MGIKYFWGYFKKNFGKHITSMKKGETFRDKNIHIDTLLIDMNGVIHNSAQKIFKYGRYKGNTIIKVSKKTERETFKDICETVESLLFLTNPSKRLVLCIDGPAPCAKQVQMRQRRYKSAMEKDSSSDEFTQNCITPGTEFMDHLSKYMDWFIRKRMSENTLWQKIDVIFSNEKTPGEGEHCAMSFVRNYGNKDETYCIHGLDADLIMLGFATHYSKFYILREDLYDDSNEFFVVDIGKSRTDLSQMMGDKHVDSENSYKYINDFIFMGFMTGNDFLPHIPSIDIIERGLDVIIDVYKNVFKSYGHITEIVNGKIKIVKPAFEAFMGTISQYEKGLFEAKLSKGTFYKDELLEKNTTNLNLDIKKYRDEYMNTKFGEEKDIEKICHQYIEGMQWVITYYIHGVPSWNWKYQHHYSPFAFHLAQHIKTFKFVNYPKTFPLKPLQQLLSVLPPKNANLLPKPLAELLTVDSSPLKPYCPEKVDIDLGGMKQEYQGIVLLPMLDFNLVKQVYFDNIKKINISDSKRNILGKTFVYIYNNEDATYTYRSYYGVISQCKVQTLPIDL